jgi:hypothetical protein
MKNNIIIVIQCFEFPLVRALDSASKFVSEGKFNANFDLVIRNNDRVFGSFLSLSREFRQLI